MSRRTFVRSLESILMIALVVFSLRATAGCGGGSPGANPPNPPTLQSITVSPQGTTVAAGLTQQFSASGNFSNGTSEPLSNVTWATSDKTVATVSASGVVTGVKQGNVTITANSEGKGGSATLTVGAPALKSMSISPQNEGVTAG